MDLKGVDMKGDMVISNFCGLFNCRDCYVENDECLDTKIMLIYSRALNEIIGTIETDLFDDGYQLNESFNKAVEQAKDVYYNATEETFSKLSVNDGVWKFELID